MLEACGPKDWKLLEIFYKSRKVSQSKFPGIKAKRVKRTNSKYFSFFLCKTVNCVVLVLECIHLGWKILPPPVLLNLLNYMECANIDANHLTQRCSYLEICLSCVNLKEETAFIFSSDK
jgi:hypothetical protein